MEWDDLITAAREVRSRAWAPYSRFLVGSAVRTTDGSVFTGCNVENRSYGLAVCAERNAITTAVAAGHRQFTAIAVVTDISPPALPCGLCRETLAEFAEDLPIVVANLAGEVEVHRLADLFPKPFRFPPQAAPEAAPAAPGQGKTPTSATRSGAPRPD